MFIMHASAIKNRMHTWIKNRGHNILTKSCRFIKEEMQLAHTNITYYLFNLTWDRGIGN